MIDLVHAETSLSRPEVVSGGKINIHLSSLLAPQSGTANANRDIRKPLNKQLTLATDNQTGHQAQSSLGLPFEIATDA